MNDDAADRATSGGPGHSTTLLDEIRDQLDTLDDVDPAEHPAAYEMIHRRLSDVLEASAARR